MPHRTIPYRESQNRGSRDVHSPDIAGRLRAMARVSLLMTVVVSTGGISPEPVPAQPLTERTPNVEGTWVTEPHDLFFQFSHRFQIAGSDADLGDLFGDGKVVNYPSFALNYGLSEHTMLGFRYSTNSLVAGEANEWQPFVKVVPLRTGDGDGGLSLSALGAWNDANASLDGELTLQGRRGPLTLILAGRGFSSPLDRDPAAEEPEFALATGANLQLNEYATFSVDYANMVTEPEAQIAWSAGLGIRIPYSPHTFTLFATNATSSTLEGLSVGVNDRTFWGFEFTIEFSGSRWGRIFDPSERSGAEEERTGPAPPGPPPEGTAGAAEGGTGSAVEVVVVENLEFGTARLEVAPGTTVRWVNRDPVVHTATSDDGSWSSPAIEPDESWERTFEEPGTYEYHCEPHPFMTGTVVVNEEEDR